jgi:hypothetical protein
MEIDYGSIPFISGMLFFNYKGVKKMRSLVTLLIIIIYLVVVGAFSGKNLNIVYTILSMYIFIWIFSFVLPKPYRINLIKWTIPTMFLNIFVIAFLSEGTMVQDSQDRLMFYFKTFSLTTLTPISILTIVDFFWNLLLRKMKNEKNVQVKLVTLKDYKKREKYLSYISFSLGAFSVTLGWINIGFITSICSLILGIIIIKRNNWVIDTRILKLVHIGVIYSTFYLILVIAFVSLVTMRDIL